MTSSTVAPIAADPKNPSKNPRLKLFLSADIIGSTAYKQPLDISKPDPNATAWENVIQAFYKEMRTNLQQAWSALDAVGPPGISNAEKGPRPVFWKTIGDEVVFWKELTGDLQIWLTLSCWLKAVADMRQWFDDNNVPQLDIKATVWVAGFPVRNKAVPVVSFATKSKMPPKNASAHLDAFYKESRSADDDNPHARIVHDVDFIGPGIDVGFRLAGFSSSKKMLISLDCAYLMAMTEAKVEKFQSGLEQKSGFFPTGCGLVGKEEGECQFFNKRLVVFFSGDEVLKGVLGGIEYPKFWISNVKHDSLESARDAFYEGSRPKLGWPDLLTYCEKFYDDRSRFIARPFINTPESASLVNLTPAHADLHNKLYGTVNPT